MTISRSYRKRESGIEALKIIAIILIVISHVAETALQGPGVVQTVDLSHGADDLQSLLMLFFHHFGRWGNMIFFTCSAWFLLSSERFDKRKWFFMLFEIWVISVAILAVSFCFLTGEISIKDIIKSLFPTYFANNWYLTCYLLFYPLHPVLNTVIHKMDQPALLRSSIALFCLYFLFSLAGGTFFGSKIIYWITMYFVIAYCKLYLADVSDSVRLNVVVMAVSFLCFAGTLFITNMLCLRFPFFAGHLYHWNVNNNPFLFVLSVSMLQLARKIRFKSVAVNYISGLSMLVYILHENIILRTYFRPQIINEIHTRFGYDHIAGWVVCTALLIFMASVIVTAIYRETIRKYVKAASDRLYGWIRRLWLAAERRIIRK